MPTPSISAIVPARNEEQNIERVVRSLAAQPEIGEIIVVNDQSTDRTAEVLARLRAEIPRLQVINGAELPPDWVGKTHAMWQGAQRAAGEWLLFTDADTEHLPGSTAQALSVATRRGAALLSYSPEQEMHRWWEKAVIPFVFCRLAARFSYERISDPVCPEAAANGQFILIRSNAYRAIGGHVAVASAVIDDVELARRVRSYGFSIYFAPGTGIVRARMYRTFGQMWEGWTKNLYPLTGRSFMGVIRELLTVLPWSVSFLFARDPKWFYLGVLLPLLQVWQYAERLRQNHFRASLISYYVLSILLYTALLLSSTLAHWRGSIGWKGRHYPVTAR